MAKVNDGTLTCQGDVNIRAQRAARQLGAGLSDFSSEKSYLECRCAAAKSRSALVKQAGPPPRAPSPATTSQAAAGLCVQNPGLLGAPASSPGAGPRP